MPGDVGQRLLHDAVRGVVDLPAQRRRGARRVYPHSQPAAAEPLDERPQPREPRAVADPVQRAAQLGEGLATGVADRRDQRQAGGVEGAHGRGEAALGGEPAGDRQHQEQPDSDAEHHPTVPRSRRARPPPGAEGVRRGTYAPPQGPGGTVKH
ncbi:hypothetical protein [Dactylosporangium sp. CA-139066]|uniref:hypothetical protein n=1 Tax=Dactylosporangium sp. CA-139066 TaxID=3239930 RepID=UPI003D94750C